MACALNAWSLPGCAWGVGGCSRPPDAAGLPNCPVSAEFIADRPAAKLIFPGAVVKATDISGESQGLNSRNAASVEHVLSVGAVSTRQVVGWYLEQLTSWGWQAVGGGAFRNHRESLSVNVDPSVGAGDLEHAPILDVYYVVDPAP